MALSDTCERRVHPDIGPTSGGSALFLWRLAVGQLYTPI